MGVQNLFRILDMLITALDVIPVQIKIIHGGISAVFMLSASCSC